MPRPERLLDPTAGPLEAFAHDLRILRRRAGNPSYRTMAKRAHYSVATLAEAARGLHKPSLKVTLAYVAACGGDEEVWSRRWHSVSSELEARDVLRRRRPGGAEREAPREPLRAGRRRPAPSPPGDAPDPGPGWHRAGGTGHPRIAVRARARTGPRAGRWTGAPNGCRTGARTAPPTGRRTAQRIGHRAGERIRSPAGRRTELRTELRTAQRIGARAAQRIVPRTAAAPVPPTGIRSAARTGARPAARTPVGGTTAPRRPPSPRPAAPPAC